MNIRRTFGIVAICVMASAGCGETHKPKIGVSVATMQEAVYTFMQQAMMDNRDTDRADVLWVSAENSESKQTADVDALLTQGIDVLILHAVNTATARDLVAKATKAEVPVIAMDRLPAGVPVRLYVTADNRKVGRDQAEFLARKINGKGNVIILEGEDGNTVARDISDGNVDALKPFSDIHVVLRRSHKNWARDLAAQTTQDALSRFKNNIQGILANNSGMAMGAVDVLRTRGLTGRVEVIGSDADRDACAAIIDGSIAADIDKMPYELGLAAYRAAMQIIRKQSVETDGTLSNDGIDVAVRRTPVRLVTPENVRRDMAYRWNNL